MADSGRGRFESLLATRADFVGATLPAMSCTAKVELSLELIPLSKPEESIDPFIN
ncbi:hypothetical protein H5410_002911 [Solanum commersonii]|uniref:Uncharacterized protein n=1 Tax=Solanum commersonii TaxID=4109 RepID=A0A9J6B3N5_SOLCO|nr:hypothetical protein H5410_002911 [Solanum commersonii]